jgi:sulfur carrier protein
VIRVNGAPSEHVDESVADLVERLGIAARGVAVALDGDVVRRSEWSTTDVPDGASVEIVTAVAGG